MIEECSKQAFNIFLENVKNGIFKTVGGTFNDTVQFDLHISKKGKVKLRNRSSVYLNLSEDIVEKLFEQLENQILPRNYEINRFITMIFDFKDLQIKTIYNQGDNVPYFKNCENCNNAGKVSSLRATIIPYLSTLTLRKYDGYSNFEVIFDRTGKFNGVRFLSPVSKGKRRINDSVLMILNDIGSLMLSDFHIKDTTKNILYALPLSYFFFESEVDMRLYFKRMAPNYLAQGDTTRFFENLMSVAGSYNRSRNFSGYVENIVSENNLSLKDSIEYRNKKLLIKDIIDNVQGYSRTYEMENDNRWIGPHYSSCAKYAAIESNHTSINNKIGDSLRHCVKESMINFILDTLDLKYGTRFKEVYLPSWIANFEENSIQISRMIQRDSSKLALYIINVRLFFDTEGTVKATDIVKCEPYYIIRQGNESGYFSNVSPTLTSLYTKAAEHNKTLRYEILDATTRIPPVNPAQLNGSAYDSSIRLYFYVLMEV